jgi:hypothetical protein
MEELFMGIIRHENGDLEFTITKDDIGLVEYLIGKYRRISADLVNYNSIDMISHYSKTKEEILVIKESNGNVKKLPYTILHKYNQEKSRCWGIGELIGDYHIPNDIEAHKENMIKYFTKKNKLNKGNQPATRIKHFEIRNNLPFLHLEAASYYDQIGTNLSLDYRKTGIYDENEENELTIRSWDKYQSNVDKKDLPKLMESKMANTLGIAVGITAYDRNNEPVVFQRKRTNKVAVYPKMWHLPLSFAHSFDFKKCTHTTFELNTIINFDLSSEIIEEMGLEISDLDTIRPIALCRDLIRGGKPQLFLEATVIPSWEEIKKRVNDRTFEYIGKIRRVGVNRNDNRSPELLAYMALKLLGNV